VPAVPGADDDSVTRQAMDAASMVIICVSEQYKDSVNCRIEAQYANHRLNQGRLKSIMYVMMQEHYTPISRENACDVRRMNCMNACTSLVLTCSQDKHLLPFLCFTIMF
jgi:hypothetical protein